MSLSTLATEIVAEHEACERASKSAVEHAVRCGELLIEAKGEVEHGQWLLWLAENFPAHINTASNYMRLAANSQRVVNSGSIREALADLAAPRPAPTPSPTSSPAPAVSRPPRPAEPPALTELRDEHARTHVIHHLATIGHKVAILRIAQDALMDQLYELSREEAERELEAVEDGYALLGEVRDGLRRHLAGGLRAVK